LLIRGRLLKLGVRPKKTYMEMAEIEKIMSLLGSLGFGAVIGALAVYLLLKSFLPSYLSEKGKNLATKEDVASITDKVESVYFLQK
jgi:hypothetical protein